MIEAKKINMSYGNKEVLKDISFTIEKGKTVGLLGVNGAGKSTTMNILTGYLKPVDGEVLICGVDMRKNPKQAKEHIGYLPEIPPLYMDMKVEEYLQFAAELKRVSDRKAEVNRVISLLNLEEYQHTFIKKLSKGLRQRVGFAQALLGNPEILILDEPLVGLDPAETKRTRTIIEELKKDHAILISSHILSNIEELCTEIIMLKDGKLVLDDKTSDAKRRNTNRMYRIVMKGEVDELQRLLEQYESLKEIQLLGEKEEGVYEFIVTAKNTRDIRDNILGYLVSKKIMVYGISKEEMSLEDVFMELNDKEETE